jgi:DNA-binding beta-propeller fold protein YncE
MAVATRLESAQPDVRVFQLAGGTSPLDLGLNAVNGQLFALESGGRLSIIDEFTRHRTVFTVPTDSFAITVDIVTGKVYVTSIDPAAAASGQMTAINPANGERTTVPAAFLGFPTVNSTTNRLYATMPYYPYHSGVGLNGILSFDGATLAHHEVSVTGPRTHAIAVDEIHDLVYVVSWPDTIFGPGPLSIVDGATETTRDVPIGCLPSTVVVDSARSRGWVGCTDTASVLMIDGDGLTATFAVGGSPTYLAVDPATGRVYAALDGQPGLVEIDPDAPPVPGALRHIPLSEPAAGLGLDTERGAIYASQATAGIVVRVDGATYEQIEISVGVGAAELVVDSTRNIVWVGTSAGVTGIYGAGAPCFRCTRTVQR